MITRRMVLLAGAGAAVWGRSGRAQGRAREVRVGVTQDALTLTPGMRCFLADQREATIRFVPEAIAEIGGIAEGFGLDAEEVFLFLHLGCLADLAAAPEDRDGCSAFAAGGIVAKNRDFRPEQAGLQRVFAQADPAWGGRQVLGLGSLGAPGAWSSGMNSDGLALADTQIATADHGPGVLRYFLMNRLLAACATVEEALGLIASLPHAGGGSLVLGDASGAVAWVELRHGRVDVARGAWAARMNHYVAAPEALAAIAHSASRLALLEAALAAGAEVVIAGRASDCALFAAPLLNAGLSPATAYYAGKLMECASFCCEPFMGKESILGRIREDDIRVTALHPGQRCTPASLASHAMYERRDPFREHVVSGYVDMSACRYEQLDERTTRASGARFVPAPQPMVKLEGAGKVGERRLAIVGMRDPYMIANLDKAIAWARARLEERFGAPEAAGWQVFYHLYGRCGVMGPMEPNPPAQPHEIGVVVETLCADGRRTPRKTPGADGCVLIR